MRVVNIMAREELMHVIGSECFTRKNAQLLTSLKTSCYKSVHKLSTSCLRTACSQLLEQAVNKLEQA